MRRTLGQGFQHQDFKQATVDVVIDGPESIRHRNQRSGKEKGIGEEVVLDRVEHLAVGHAGEVDIEFAVGALKDHASNQHMIGNTLIDVEGDEAFGEVYFHAYHKVESEAGFDDLIVAGRYLDRYERRDGVWKMAYRSERVDWSRTTPTQDA